MRSAVNTVLIVLYAVLAVLFPSVIADDNQEYRSTLRTHSLFPPYLDQDVQSRWWDFGGDTVINANKHVRLTYDRPSQTGWLFSRLPLTASNFEIEFEFKVSGSGQNIFGDGMAVWITKERAQSGPVFGFVDKFEGLGIFIDTYKNNRPGTMFPYVMAMLGDGKTEYDHDHDGKANEIGGCSARGLRGASIPTKGRITYYKDNYLELQLQYKNEDQWITCFNAPHVTLPTVSYLGFTALTGELSDNHDIISVKAQNIYTPTVANPQQAPVNASVPKANRGSGWGMFLVKLVFIGAVCGSLYVAWTMYAKQRRRSSRF
ncbi:hypothetical protein YB2330_001381 [Saitoella coloradoensis]